MRFPRAFAGALAVSSLLAASAFAGPPRGTVLVRPHGLGAAAGATWLPDGGSGLRVVGDGTRVTVAPVAAGTGRYIVRFTEGAPAASAPERVAARDALEQRFEQALARSDPGRFGVSGDAGVRVTRRFDRLIAGAAVEAPAHWEAALRALPGVAAVEEDREVQASLDRSVAQVRGDLVRNLLHGTGRGVRVGLVDTGIDYHHPAFGGAFGPGTRVAGGEDFVNRDGDPMDDMGHGTHVAGIIAGNGGGVVGMATEATLYAYKVLDANGSGRTSDVLAALERCADPDQDPTTDDHLDVVNMSLGAGGGDPDDAFSRAVDALDAMGTTVVVAAGNAFTLFTIADPAIARGAVAVGAVDRQDGTAVFSSRGPGPDLVPKPDLAAPGTDIVSAALGGGRIAMTGTSMAAPHVAGAVALLRQLHPEWTHEELRSALIGAAKNTGRAIYEQGAGRLDAYASATATLFALPTRLAFGRVLPDCGDTTLTLGLRVRSHAAGAQTVTLRAVPEGNPPGVDVLVEPGQIVLANGAEQTVAVRLTVHAARASNRTPPFAAEGVIEVQDGSEVRRVPYSLHDCLELRVRDRGSDIVGVVHDAQRAWPAKGFASTWLLPAGTYDAMAFGFGLDRPFKLARGLLLSADAQVDVGDMPLDRALAWGFVGHDAQPLAATRMDLRLVHASGAFLGIVGFPPIAASLVPEAGPDYKLEWSAYIDTGPVRADVAGAATGPFTSGTQSNDPARLRRVTQHFTVAPGDSVVPLDFRMYPDGSGHEFGIAHVNGLAPPVTQSYDVDEWISPAPYRGHYRLGRWYIQARDAAFHRGVGELYASMAPLLSLDRGDTVGVHPNELADAAVLDLTGDRIGLGEGPAIFAGSLVAENEAFMIDEEPSHSQRVFGDALGTKHTGPPASYELTVDGRVVVADTLADEGGVLGSPQLAQMYPHQQGTHGMFVLHSAESHVLDTPSRTTVRAAFAPQASATITPTLRSFAVLASGNAVQEVRFGRVHAPHVEFTVGVTMPGQPIQAEVLYRVGSSAAWTPLAVHAEGLRYRAPLVPADGPVSLRLRLGTVKYGTLEMDVEPAFIGRRSPGAGAPVLQATADAAGVHVEWRVGGAEGPLVVERAEPGGAFAEVGDAAVADDGVARFADAAVTPGGRYGYRLAGSTAPVWVQVPAGAPGLSLAIASNPARGDVRLALSVDRTAPLELSLVDVQGRVVQRRVVDGLAPGAHVFDLDTSAHTPPGLYFVRLVRGSDVMTRRVILLR